VRSFETELDAGGSDDHNNAFRLYPGDLKKVLCIKKYISVPQLTNENTLHLKHIRK
jgi:hypothetical protein